MKIQGPLLVVSDLEASKKFYREVFGLRVTLDFGANVTLTGGLSLQTKESWAGFLEKSQEEITFGGNDMELYFEAEDFDAFIEDLEKLDAIRYVHPVKEHPWGPPVRPGSSHCGNRGIYEGGVQKVFRFRYGGGRYRKADGRTGKVCQRLSAVTSEGQACFPRAWPSFRLVKTAPGENQTAAKAAVCPSRIRA